MPGYDKSNRQEADFQQVQKGTVQHEIFDVPKLSGDIELFVQCRKDATDALDASIPYAICFTIEAKEEISVDLYVQIRNSIRTTIPIT